MLSTKESSAARGGISRRDPFGPLHSVRFSPASISREFGFAKKVTYADSYGHLRDGIIGACGYHRGRHTPDSRGKRHHAAAAADDIGGSPHGQRQRNPHHR